MVRSVVIEDHPNYELHSDGTVWRIGSSAPLINDISGRYAFVKLDGRNCCVHRLMGKYFIERTRLDRTYIFHIDGDAFNNSEENLIWLTPHESQLMRHYLLETRMKYVRAIQCGEEVEFV